ncbi:hypothetical protein [Saccharopolyspora pogona]|uniref:hypothetical protein n=1 Tax=Saccharopolyspora pogona TaxID=333966 RepID=UPI001683352C|nr:hypothetical protein [Saccharopolyspora pogona]
MRNRYARTIAALSVSAALAGGGFAIGTTANAAPAADSSTVATAAMQVHPARHCWWVQGSRHHVWHHGSWSWASTPSRWHCR